MDRCPPKNLKLFSRVYPLCPEDEIVISGISGRYPNSKNVSDFADNLYSKTDMVDDEEKRWRNTNPEIPKRMGKVHNLEKFDATFFGVHFKQAHTMDPQCRLLLEHAYEAVLDAGVNPRSLRGSRTGVFMGACFAESEKTWFYEKVSSGGFGITGCSRAMLANRVSFCLGLNGPSFLCDTACSSSMYALDIAFNSIRSGECDAALVGGSNLILHPYVTLQFARLGVLAPSGYCCPFDKDATGYTRSEAISVVYLQKAKDAKRVYADFIYSKANCDGYKEEGITFPSGKMQKRLLKEFYEDLEMDPRKVDYVEAHSTGTIVGDPEECKALDEVFCTGRKTALPTGSVKSNMGHSESTSGVCSLTKCILIFENKLIPANINYTIYRPGIESLESGRLRVVTETEPFDGSLISINSFGFGGGNAHALFRGNRKEKINHGIPTDNLPRLVNWSGRTELAVNNIIDSVLKKPLDAEYVGLLHSCMMGESTQALIYRGYGVYAQNGSDENATCLHRGTQHFVGFKRPVVWVYSGMGSQWSSMGKDLMKIPIFAESIEKSHNVLATRGLNLKEIITSDDPTMFNTILHSFVGIAAVQIGLTDVLKALGLEPDFVIGHSVGELGCAYADGCFTAEEMILSSYSRGMASIETKTVFGSMAAVGLGYKKLKTMVPEGIEIACHNSSDSSTISGPAELIKSFVEELKSKEIFAKEVASNNIPYHSKYIAAMGPNLLNRLQQVIVEPKKRSAKWICSSVPKNRWDTELAQFSSAEYHTNNLLSPVLFEEAAINLPRNALTIEVAPHSLLQAILKKSMPEAIHVGLTRRENKANETFFLNSLGTLFMHGIDFDVSKLYPKVDFPVSRGTPMIAPLVDWEHSEDWFVTKFENQKGNRSGERHIVLNLADVDHEYISGHVIDGRILFPATAYIHLVWETLGLVLGKYYFDLKVEFEDVKFLRATAVPKNQDIDFTVMIQPGSGKFEITESNSTLVTGIVRIVDKTTLYNIEKPKENDSPMLSKKDFYKELRLRGYHYNGLFRSVEESRGDGMIGKVTWNASNWVAFMDCLLQVNIIGNDTRNLMIPTGIQKLTIDPDVHKQVIGAFESDVAGVEVYSDKALNILRSGGIEMRGLTASVVGRRKPQGLPVLESYQFISHLPTPYLTKEEMSRFCVQLALENLPTNKVLSMEIDNYDGKEPLSELFGAAFGDLPLVTAELNYMTTNEEKNYDMLNVESPTKIMKNCLMVIKSNSISDETFLNTICDQMCDKGYLISRENVDFNFKLLNQIPKFYSVVAVVPSDQETYVMLQFSKKETKRTEKIFKLSSSSYEWLEELKSEVKKGPVIAYSQNETFSGIIGFVNCIRKEPNGLNLRCVFIDDSNAPPFDIENYFYKSQLQLGLAVNVFKNGQWGSYKHFLLTKTVEPYPRVDHCYANCLTRGDLSSMTWLDGPFNYGKPDREIARVVYSSLNFRDVMLATGKISGDVTAISRLDQQCILGFEYSGVMEQSGKRVMGMIISGAMSTHVEADEILTWNVPDHFTLEDAATIPVVYGTVYASFFLTTYIQEGKKILIHAGTGGVGLAAIRVALAYGLEVFATVSTEEKKKYLLSEFPQLKEENIGNSRDTSFEDMIMMRTNGKGVDYVLNSLADDKLQASIRCLGKGGIFLEIGKFDMMNDSKIGLANFLRELSFHSVLVDNLLRSSPENKLRLQTIVEKDLKRGIIKPLKTTVFEANHIEQAFRFLASGKHMGKVLLKMREDGNQLHSYPIAVHPCAYCNPNLSYIIPGGLGGFGLELADWLVLRGCKKLVLSSSRGITKHYQSYRIKIWESYGVQVHVNTSNITTRAGCEKLIRDSMKLGPVGGIFNLAVQLRDNIFENQDADKFIECMGPKADATKHIDELSRQLCPELQHFVVFSSVSCGRGNAGQTNYGMANSVMERIIEHRHQLGLPAKAIQWGAIGEVGLVADLQEDHVEMEIGGTLQQRISSCLEELDKLLTCDNPIVGSMVVAEKRVKTGSGMDAIQAVMNIMSIRDIKSVSMDATLSDIGMDSLMAVEIRQMLEREYELFLSPQDLRTLTFFKLKELTAVEKSDSDNVRVKFATDEVAVGVELLLRNLGDEKTSDETVLRLISQDNGTTTTSCAFIVPGIEGVAGNAWRSVANSIELPTYMLQLMSTKEATTIEEIVSRVFDEVTQSVFSNNETFYIIGYSFGALIALDMARKLEAKGKTGRIVLIDGAPAFLKKLVVDQMPTSDIEEGVQAVLINGLLRIVFPEEKIDALNIMREHPTWEKRVDKMVELGKDQYLYSIDYLRTMAYCLYSRIKMVISYKTDTRQSLRAPITLVRPNEISIVDIDEDYGLQKLTRGEVVVKFVSGNHLTMIENPKLPLIINELNPELQSNKSFMKQHEI